jgi:HNH endonuclease
MTRSSSSPEALFWSKVDLEGPVSNLLGTPCWVWTASTNGKAGYGRLEVSSDWGGWRMLARRFSWELAYGPIPPGLAVDHLCRNTLCVKPAHLEVGKQRTNVLRGISPCARDALKTACPSGHEYTPENTWVYRGMRYCRTCRNVWKPRKRGSR